MQVSHYSHFHSRNSRTNRPYNQNPLREEQQLFAKTWKFEMQGLWFLAGQN